MKKPAKTVDLVKSGVVKKKQEAEIPFFLFSINAREISEARAFICLREI